MDPFLVLGFFLVVVVIYVLFVGPISYLIEEDIEDRNSKGVSLGCFAFLCFLVGIPVGIVGLWLEGKGIIPYGDSDQFVIKWFSIIMGGISVLLIITCITKALYNHFNE